jgi:ligand-binding SRPBCC domain-containing protein
MPWTLRPRSRDIFSVKSTLARIELITHISAPIERCFDLSRSIDLHLKSTELTLEEAIAGKTSGLIGLNETVKWRGRHFGLRLTHESLVDRYDRPRYFRDIMVSGMFRRFEHEHIFKETAHNHTKMQDVLIVESPTVFGALVDAVFLRNYISRFLESRNRVIKRVAESAEWTSFLA